jgi:uncharacterized protein (DUF1800 family)
VWLDQAQSRKDHPNENYAREVMELFSLGEGHYTEKDITEGARALTGWSLDRINQKYVYRPFIHDNGTKVYLGREGNLDGNDVIAQIVAQPQAALFITAKLWNYFAGEMPSPELNAALAGVFRANGNNFQPFLAVMFRSEEFYSPDIIRNQVKSPVQWLVGSVRMLECELPPPLICLGMLRQLGQDLFAPPNVKGWDGGVTWITINTLLTRYNDAQSLVRGTVPQFNAGDFARKAGGMGGQRVARAIQNMRMGGVNLEKILTPTELATKNELVAALERRLLQAPLSGDQDSDRDPAGHEHPGISSGVTPGPHEKRNHPPDAPAVPAHDHARQRPFVDGPGFPGGHLFRAARQCRRFRDPVRHRQGFHHSCRASDGRRQ